MDESSLRENMQLEKLRALTCDTLDEADREACLRAICPPGWG